MSLRSAIEGTPAAGYRWWYVDGLSDDGRRGFTAIFLYGSVFSPWRWGRFARGGSAAADNLGVHVALYEDGREIGWTMAHHRADAFAVEEARLRIGGSWLRQLDGGALEGGAAFAFSTP